MSERVVWKAYYDFENEERWLNEMAANGWEMTGYSWCRYTFSEGLPGRYTYRIQLLEDAAASPKSREYLDFLADAGMEVVATYNRWIYIRKIADGQPFDLFSDRDSRIAHHKRVAALFGVFFAAQVPLVVVSIKNVITQIQENVFFGVPLSVAHIALVGVLGAVALRQYLSVRRLEKDALVHE